MGMVKILGFPSWLPRHWSHWCRSYPPLRRCCRCDRPACVSPGSAVSPRTHSESRAGSLSIQHQPDTWDQLQVCTLWNQTLEKLWKHHGFIHEQMGHLWFIRQTTRKRGQTWILLWNIGTHVGFEMNNGDMTWCKPTKLSKGTTD
jgi:hypothetical protein